MQQKTIKLLTSLVVIAIFVVILLASSPSKGQLIAPASAALPAGTPANSFTNPTIVSGVPFTLSVSPVTNATGYEFQIFTTDARGTPATTYALSRSSKTTSYQMTTADVAAGKLQNNVVYAWKTRGTAGTRLGAWSAWFYFKITPTTTSQKAGSVLIYNFFASNDKGEVYKYDPTANKWGVVSSPKATTKAPTVAPAPVQSTGKGLVGVVRNVGTAVTNVVRGVVNFFTGVNQSTGVLNQQQN